MFDGLKSFLKELSREDAPPRGFGANDYRLAAAALLVHIASVDGRFDAVEEARLRALVEQRFGLDRAAASSLLEEAWECEREAVDLYRFTSVLKRALDEASRAQIVEMLWEMAYADGAVHEFEENVVWRVAELLGVSARDRIAMKIGARDEAERSERPTDAGPWNRKESDEA